MMNSTLEGRIVRGCGLAALDYAAAANQAYFETASQVISFWTETLGSPDNEPEPRSWYRHPDTGRPVSPNRTPFCPTNAFANQFAAWQAMAVAPWTLPPTAWPSAFSMMAVGVPKSVAWPAAEANAAVVDVAQAVAETTFSTYRSDGGHAVAQVVMLPMKSLLGTAAALPMLDMVQNATLNWASLFMQPRGF